MSGTLIRLVLVEGNPNGLKTVELSNKTIYGTIFPRTKLKSFLDRSESEKLGCYILLGKDLQQLEQLNVYIGESENVGERLKSHAFGNSQKEFWDEVIVFTSKDDYITKTQIRYLESAIHSLAEEAGLVKLVNTQTPVIPNLSEVDNAEMEDFLKGIRLILSSLGIDMLESKRVGKAEEKTEKEILYQFNMKGAITHMRIEEDQFVVLKGSTAVIKNRKSAKNPIIKLRADLV